MEYGKPNPSSNRTFMELKWNGGDEVLFSLYSSNRTFMELKWNGGDEVLFSLYMF